MTNAFLNSCIALRVFSRGSRTRKFTQYLALLLFGAFAGSAVAQSARGHARTEVAPPLIYNDGDLFVGFRATDRTHDYLVNIGQPAPFVNAAPGSTFSVVVGGTSADLVATFGADWYTRIDPNTGRNAVLWGVVGGRAIGASGDPESTLYSTNPLSNPWPSRSDGAQSATQSLIAQMGNTFAGNQPSSNNPQGLVQGATSSNSYATFEPGGVNSNGISFQTWNPSNDAGPATQLFFNRIAANACTTVLGSLLLDTSGQISFTATLAPTPINISGSIRYCSNPGLPPVPNVTLTLSGAMSGSTVSDGSGNYTLSSLPSGGTYIVTPSKAALTPGSAGINTVDVIAAQRHLLNITPLSGCRLTAADVNGDTSVNTVDVIAIQRFLLNLTTGLANVGKYQFTPASRTYQGLFCARTGQTYDALIFGDVSTTFVHRPGGASQDAADNGPNDDEVASTVAAVSLPNSTVDASATTFIAQVATTTINAGDKLVGFQGDFTFDERVVTFESEPVQNAGLTAGDWNVSGNVLDAPGPIRTLRVSAFSNDFTPLSGSGTLFELRMIRVSKAAQNAQLIWAAPPNQFFFIDADLKTQKPGYTASGGVTTAGTRK